jgi:hypothetical protein
MEIYKKVSLTHQAWNDNQAPFVKGQGVQITSSACVVSSKTGDSEDRTMSFVNVIYRSKVVPFMSVKSIQACIQIPEQGISLCETDKVHENKSRK